MITAKKFNPIFEEVLEKVLPSKERLKIIEDYLEKFIAELKSRLRFKKINAEIFIGGSYAKNTLIKKDKYDVDIFVRFNKKYENEKISEILENLLKGIEYKKIKGSREYFKIKPHPSFFIELVPVLKVQSPKQSANITDLSYSHVQYINKKMKKKELLDEIRIAKAFCFANHCYGAESYIKGFSGYTLELLIYNYGSFLKFIRAISKLRKGEKLIIDIEKLHKNKKNILLDLNESKLQSPIILIDPTFKQRNVAAGLSEETLEKFKKVCTKFLKNPSIKLFEEEKTNLEKIEKDAKKKNYEFILLEAETEKQEGDIAGNKLLKFYNSLVEDVGKYFEIKKKGFNYNGKQAARYYFVCKRRGQILHKGPNVKNKKHVERFTKKHKDYFTKSKRIYSKEYLKFNLEDFLENWKKKNKNKIKDMYVKSLRVI